LLAADVAGAVTAHRQHRRIQIIRARFCTALDPGIVHRGLRYDGSSSG